MSRCFAARLGLIATVLAGLPACSVVRWWQIGWDEVQAIPREAEREYKAEREEYENSIPRCSNAVECDAKWEAARQWMSENCSSHIEQLSADSMQTASGPWCRVTKALEGEQRYKISLEVPPDVTWLARLDVALYRRLQFNQFVNGVLEAPDATVSRPPP